jgi:alpha-ketoglutarate-dependent taurine dioxygenase
MMKQLQRLLVQQGHKCFFCGGPIPPGEASVEHLDALSNGGENTGQNCVACCKAINTARGNLSIKDKIRAILSQPNPFPCPRASLPEEPAARLVRTTSNLFETTLDIIRRHGDKAPRRKSTMFNAVKVEVPDVTEAQLAALFDELIAKKVVTMSGVKILYHGLFDKA